MISFYKWHVFFICINRVINKSNDKHHEFNCCFASNCKYLISKLSISYNVYFLHNNGMTQTWDFFKKKTQCLTTQAQLKLRSFEAGTFAWTMSCKFIIHFIGKNFIWWNMSKESLIVNYSYFISASLFMLEIKWGYSTIN